MKENKFKKFIYIFLLLQPILSLYIFYIDEVRNLFKFSPSTIIRVIFILFMFVVTLFFIKDDKGNKKTNKIFDIKVLGGLLIYGIYTVIHVFLVRKNIANMPPNFKFSLFGEVFYLVRMFLPIIMMFIFSKIDFDKDEFVKLMVRILLIYSGVIVVSNIFGVSFMAYSDNSIPIYSNIFSWFSNNFSLISNSLTSRGLFQIANELGGILTLLFPVALYSLLSNKDLESKIAVHLTIIAMIMVGTRIASFMPFLIMIAMIVLNLFFHYILKDGKYDYVSNSKRLSIYLVIYFNIFIYSPLSYRYNITLKLSNILKLIPNYLLIIYGLLFLLLVVFVIMLIRDKKFVRKYSYNLLLIFIILLSVVNINRSAKMMGETSGVIGSGHNVTIEPGEENYAFCYLDNDATLEFTEFCLEESGMNEIFYKKQYPLKDNKDFYIRLNNIILSNELMTRDVHIQIARDVLQKSNNPKVNSLFGLGYTTFRSSDVYIEKDYVMQSFTLGYIGLLLFIAPYIISLFIVIYNVSRKQKIRINMFNVVLFVSICLVLLIGYMSGHIIDELITTILLGSYVGLLLNQSRKEG